jgi:ATP-binding cassette subfamily B protein
LNGAASGTIMRPNLPGHATNPRRSVSFFSDPDFRAVVRDRRARIAAGFACLLGRSGLVLLVPILIGLAMDEVFAREGWDAVLRTLGMLLLVSAATALCQFGMRYLLVGASRDVELRLRENLFRHLLTLSWPFYNRSRTGDLMSRLTSDVESIRMGVGPGVMYVADTGLRTLGAVLVMGRISPLLTATAIAPMAVIFLLLRPLLRRIHDVSLRIQEDQAALASRAQESFSGARVVKAFGREHAEEARFGGISERWAALNVDLAKDRALLTILIETGGGLALVAILAIGGWQVVEGTMRVGQLVAFIGYLQLLIWPMIAIGWVLSLWERAEASEGRLATLRSEVPDIVAPAAASLPSVRGDVEFRGLSYEHPGAGRLVLDGVSLAIPAGTSLGIVGRTGAGKSTLIHFIPRLLDPPPGTVFVDGRDVRAWPLDALRGAIGLVPQDTFLFSDTIEANVAFGLDRIDEAVVARASGVAALDEAIASFPDGIRTVVGERGITLSGGQRQRAAIARALATDPRILILDDCLSAVDTETEGRILAGLRDVIRERTTIVISHRMTAVMDLDHIAVLDEGRIVESGTHAGLIEKNGLYAELVRLQQIEAELESG